MRVKILYSKILECQKFGIWKLTNVKKIDKFVNFPYCKIPKNSEIVQFRKIVFKTIKIQKTSNLVNYLSYIHICILSVCRIKKKKNVKIKNKFKNRKIE